MAIWTSWLGRFLRQWLRRMRLFWWRSFAKKTQQSKATERIQRIGSTNRKAFDESWPQMTKEGLFDPEWPQKFQFDDVDFSNSFLQFVDFKKGKQKNANFGIRSRADRVPEPCGEDLLPRPIDNPPGEFEIGFWQPPNSRSTYWDLSFYSK